MSTELVGDIVSFCCDLLCSLDCFWDVCCGICGMVCEACNEPESHNRQSRARGEGYEPIGDNTDPLE